MEKRFKLFNISMKKERKCKTKIQNKINYQILIIFFIFSYSIGIKSSPFGISYDSIISIIIQKNNLKNQQSIINQDYIPFIKEIYINTIKQENIANSYNIDEPNNSIKQENMTNSYNINEIDEQNKTIQIKFYDNITSFENMFSYLNNILMIDLSQFTDAYIINMENMFMNCYDLISINFGNFKASSVASMKNLFYGCSKITSLNLNQFDTSKVENMDSMFERCENLKKLDLSKFNNKSLMSMIKMFYSCITLEILILPNNFCTNKITNLNSLFRNCHKLNSIDLSKFDTSSVTNMEYMFSHCQNISSFDFSKFNTTNVETMSHMFEYCSSIISLDLSNFYTFNVLNMDSMFYNCIHLENINIKIEITDENQIGVITDIICFGLHPLSKKKRKECKNSYASTLEIYNFQTLNVKYMQNMFGSCTKINTIDLSRFDTSSVENMEYMFSDCSNLESININGINTSLVTNMDGLFQGCTKLMNIDFSLFKTDSLKTIRNIFQNCNINLIEQSKNFDISNVEDISYMFQSCKDLISFDLSNLKISSVKYMEGIFDGCSNLESVTIKNELISNVISMNRIFQGCTSLQSIDLSNLKASSLKNISFMFGNCNNLISVNLNNFEAPLISDMSYMFYSCVNLRSIDLNNFKTDSLISMGHLFENCHNLSFINLSNFDTSKVIDMSYMFHSCIGLSSVYFSNLNLSSLERIDHLFDNCQNLISVNLNDFEAPKVGDMSYMFYSCVSLKSIDLQNFKAPLLKNMNNAFSFCNNLEYVDLSNLIASKLEDISYLFYNCYNLKSLKIYKIETLSIINMGNMFNNCSSLKYLDLSNFSTQSLVNMENMFNNCHNLEYLNISNLNTNLVNNMNQIFSNCSSLKYLDLSNFKTSLITDMSFMFYNCSNLLSLNIPNFNTLKVINMSYMFSDCRNLTFIDLSKFQTLSPADIDYMFYNCNSLKSIGISNDTKIKVKNMIYLFSQCKELKSIDISIFDTKEVTKMENLFNGCHSLTSLNFSAINTAKVINMSYLFFDCDSLESIELFNLDTSAVIDIGNMFNGCQSLTTLNMSSFHTPKLLNMDSLFNNCKNLKFISDMSNFDTSSVTNMRYMFSGCENLQLLEIKNFDCSNVNDISNMFENCKSLIYINSGKKNNNIAFLKYDKIFDNNPNDTKYCIEISNHDIFINYSITSNCSNKCFQEDISIIFEKRQCIEKCEYDNDYKYEYNKKCFKNCPNGTHPSYIDEFLCEDDIICPEFNINNERCEENAKYGYYLDKNDGIYKACYRNCKKCYGSGNEYNNNCLECIENMTFIFESLPFNPRNCYPKCNQYYYIDINNNYLCTNNSTCPSNYEKLVSNKNKCIDKCKNDNVYQFEYNNNCYISCPNNTIYLSNKKICYEKESISNDTTKADIAEKEEKIKSLQEDLMNGDMNDIIKNITENKEDYVQNENDLILQISTSENQRNNNNTNLSTIDLGNCEDELKTVYNISKNLSLIILKIDYYTKDTLIPIIGYEIYHPITKEKLNLSYCEDILIKLNIPVNIDEDKLFKYDPNSKFYTDSCNSYTTEDGTDIILNDRKKEFGSNNLSLCENNCNYVGYNPKNKQSICNCDIKDKMESISEISENTEKLSNAFSSDSSSSSNNIISIKCAKNLFTSDGLKNNISSYVLLFIIFYFLLSILLFIKCGYQLLIMDMDKIIKSKQKKSNLKNKKKITNNKNKIIKIIDQNSYNPPFKRIKNRTSKSTNSKIQKRYETKTKAKLRLMNFINHKNIESNETEIKKKNNQKEKTIIKTIINDRPKISIDKKIKKLDLNNYELNKLCYMDALKFDKRTCCEYYISLLRIKHPILFGFCPFNDYNTLIIKSCIFFLSFAVYYAMNFVFFSENTIHKIYEDGGNYDFLYFIPQISISFAASHVVTIIIKLLFLSERNISNIKSKQTYNDAYNIYEKEKRNLIIKYIFFFILGIIFLGIFWLFLSSFGAVYQNTQIVVFENTLISFAISLVYPIFFNFIPCIFRICSLSSKNKNLGAIYSFSKFLQII